MVNGGHAMAHVGVLLVNMQQKEFETEVRQIRSRIHLEAMHYLQDSEEAEDTTQETILKLWSMRQDLERYRSIEALAMVIVRRLALSRLRNRKSVAPLADSYIEVPMSITPETELIGREEEERVMQMIGRLPNVQQTVLRMKHVDGMETKEIARVIGCSEETVRSNLSRARKKIMKMFMK